MQIKELRPTRRAAVIDFALALAVPGAVLNQTGIDPTADLWVVLLVGAAWVLRKDLKQLMCALVDVFRVSELEQGEPA